MTFFASFWDLYLQTPNCPFYTHFIFWEYKHVVYLVCWSINGLKQTVAGSGMTKRQRWSLSLSLGTTKSLDGRSDSQSSRGSNSPGTSGNDLSALLALPDTDARSLHGVLTAEGAGIAINHTSTRCSYVLCWVISIFFTILRREEPYLVPYFPQIPTFLVLLPYSYS